jgi:hypothetical protein
MRSKRMLIVFLAIASVPALAAKSTPVEQLQQTLAANETAHQSDDVLMQQIANTRLTARLSPGALRQLVALSPGPKTTQTLHAIADIAAFLDPPPDEIPATRHPAQRNSLPSSNGLCTTLCTSNRPCLISSRPA